MAEARLDDAGHHVVVRVVRARPVVDRARVRDALPAVRADAAVQADAVAAPLVGAPAAAAACGRA